MKILNIIPIKQNIYENFFENSLEFVCPDCSEKIEINFLYELNLLENLVVNNSLSKEDIIKNGMAKLTTKFDKHLGLFSVFPNLAAYYRLFTCSKSSRDFIIVFGFGESQPGRNLAYVSGIWCYN